MGFLKSLLGLGGDDAAAKNDDNKSKEFDVLKYDGVRALRMNMRSRYMMTLRPVTISPSLICDSATSRAPTSISAVSPKLSPITSRYGCVWPMWPICVKTTTPSNR